ncbi:hypothetical protein Q3G72_016889 [Acer saccharum]|nr:hypothetical protein Q3G72_016889 [Acer saccharum]
MYLRSSGIRRFCFGEWSLSSGYSYEWDLFLKVGEMGPEEASKLLVQTEIGPSLWSRRPRLQRHFRLKPTNESDHGRFRVFLALFIEILSAKGDQTPNLGVQFSPLMVIIACHAREQPQLSCRYHRRRSQCELSKKLSWTRQLGKNPKRKEKKE